jgi:hypothetical protein
MPTFYKFDHPQTRTIIGSGLNSRMNLGLEKELETRSSQASGSRSTHCGQNGAKSPPRVAFRPTREVHFIFAPVELVFSKYKLSIDRKLYLNTFGFAIGHWAEPLTVYRKMN